jgi:hypothetical protein
MGEVSGQCDSSVAAAELVVGGGEDPGDVLDDVSLMHRGLPTEADLNPIQPDSSVGVRPRGHDQCVELVDRVREHTVTGGVQAGPRQLDQRGDPVDSAGAA